MNCLLFVALITPTLDLLQNIWMIDWHMLFHFWHGHIQIHHPNPFFIFIFFPTCFLRKSHFGMNNFYLLSTLAHTLQFIAKIFITIKHTFYPWHLHQPHIRKFFNHIYLECFLGFFLVEAIIWKTTTIVFGLRFASRVGIWALKSRMTLIKNIYSSKCKMYKTSSKFSLSLGFNFMR